VSCLVSGLTNFSVIPVYAEHKLSINSSRIINESKPRPDDFRESKGGGSIVSLYAYSGLSLVGIIISFFVIKKWKNKK